jgi:uncharacterized DUF497 family protein
VNAVVFQWDEAKALANNEKHNVSFEEAKTAFEDERGLFKADPDHSEDEERFLLLGMSDRLRLLLVVHCFRDEESVIRIISARTATKRERQQYLEVAR